MNERVLNVRIDGMHCGSCVNRIDRAARLAGATTVDINIGRHFGRLRFDADTTNPDNVVKAIKDAGYDVTTLSVLNPDDIA